MFKQVQAIILRGKFPERFNVLLYYRELGTVRF